MSAPNAEVYNIAFYTAMCHIGEPVTGYDKNIASSDNINLYPNPVKDILTIENIQSVKKISIQSITGQTVKEIVPNRKNKITIDTESIQPGYYVLLFINNDKSLSVKKIIKY